GSADRWGGNAASSRQVVRQAMRARPIASKAGLASARGQSAQRGNELRANRFHSLAVLLVKAGQTVAVHVPHAQQRAIGAHQWHHDFGARGAVAINVVRESSHVGDQLALVQLRRGATHAAPAGNAHTGGPALKGADYEVVALGKVKAAPA